MLAKIKLFFEQQVAANLDSPQQSEHALQVATSVLLLEMVRADFHVDDQELAQVAQSIGQIFQLQDDETEELLSLAEQAAQDAACYHQFTSLINQQFDVQQKVKIIENMWRVAYADGKLQKYEESLVRKIAELLYVKHSAFIAAKHRVQNELSS